MSDVIDPIQQRYGRKAPNRKAIIGSAIALLLVFLIWAFYATVAGVKPTFKTVSYVVVDSSHVQVEFLVNKPADRAVTCAIQALKQDYGIVGYKELSFGQGLSQESGSVLLNTTEEAVTGLVDHCWCD